MDSFITSVGGFFAILTSQPVVTAIMVADLAALFVVVVYFRRSVSRYSRNAEETIAEVDRIASDAAQSFSRGTRSAEESPSEHAREAWAEYSKTLFQSADGVTLYSTDDAERFFNTRTLAPELFKDSLLAAIPSMLTAIGVLATFLGLSVGLGGVDISPDADTGALLQGINTLISSAGVAFITSIGGVLTSLYATFTLKKREGVMERNVAALEADVDKRFVRYSAESGLFGMETHTRETAESMAELHEKIGVKLQTAVDGLSQEMQTAFVTAIDRALAPALDKLTTDTSKQSAEVFEALVGRFSGAFEHMGDAQSTAMQSASDSLVNSVTTMGAQLGHSLSAVQSAAEEDRLANRQALEQMRSAVDTQVEDIRSATTDQAEQLRAATQEQAEADRQSTAALMAELRSTGQQQLKRFHDEASEQTHVLQTQLSDLTSLTEQQHQSSSRTVEQLAQLAESTRAAMATSAERLTDSAAHLEKVASDFSTTSRDVSGRLADSTASIAAVSAQQTKSLEALDRHSGSIDRIADLSGTTAERLSEASVEAKSSFEMMRLHQNEFVDEIESALTRAQSQIVNEIEEVSKSMSDWLNEYSDGVRSQTNERLDEWNKQTTQFASEMLTVSRSLSDVVDEMERRSTNGTPPRAKR